MRIDAYMQVSQLYNTNRTKAKTNTVNPTASDSLQISNFGNAYHVAKQAAAQAVEKGQDVRMDKVQDIKERMQAGTYDVSLEDVAEKLADQLSF
ncbi:MAG: flagellar biosynthesis anti-sigma factor FlgM [Eubacterium sp.]|nr:flagellar biosynthesis anti-sigma factor FlgM [Eubacterium sp.]